MHDAIRAGEIGQLLVLAILVAGDLVIAVVLELLDRACLEAVEEWKHLGIDADAAALLLARVDTPGDSGAAEASAIAATMTAAGALWAEQSTDDAEAEALFDARRLAYPALERLGPVLTEDVCVPRSQVPAMLEQISAIAARHGVRTATVAHAGELAVARKPRGTPVTESLWLIHVVCSAGRSRNSGSRVVGRCRSAMASGPSSAARRAR